MMIIMFHIILMLNLKNACSCITKYNKRCFHILLYVKRLYAFIIHCDSCKTKKQTRPAKQKTKVARPGVPHYILS